MLTYYDDALPRFAEIVAKGLGSEAVLRNLFLRDATGRITFVVTEKLSQESIRQLRTAAATLSPYVQDSEEAIGSPEQLFDVSLNDPLAGRFEYLNHPAFSGYVRVFERRIVGRDVGSFSSCPVLVAHHLSASGLR